MTAITVMAYGDRALLVEFGSAAAVIGFREAVIRAANSAIVSVLPAARTVLVEFEPALISRAGLVEFLHDCAEPAATIADRPPASELTLRVRYDGADLDAVAASCQLSIEQLISRHTDGVYTVQFCGFSPGFGYLTGLDPALRLPRLATPRPEVPAGSVAIADEFTAVYPRASPGGWRLLGRTDTALFDLDRSPPALLSPGTRVRFVRS